ncbi:MAG: hypothetical protein ACLRTD_28945 [Bacteroides sp.]
MKKYLFILMAASLVMYSCESDDDNSPVNNPVDTEFSTDRSVGIKAFSSEMHAYSQPLIKKQDALNAFEEGTNLQLSSLIKILQKKHTDMY